MAITDKIANRILSNSTENSFVPKTIKSFANTKIVKKATDRCINAEFETINKNTVQKDKFFNSTVLGLAAPLAKDAIGCACYVYADLHNKQIPEEQRPFSAAWDLINGCLGIGIQLLTYFVTKPLFNKIFEKSTNPIYKGQRDAIIANAVKQTNRPKEEVAKIADKIIAENKKAAKSGFDLITGLIITTIVAKRIISPLISTPLASKVKPYVQKVFGGKNKEKDETKSQKLNAKA